MDEPFVIIRETGVIAYASPAAGKLFGYAASELQGEPLTRILQIPEQFDMSAAAFWRRASVTPVLPAVHRSGRTFALHLEQKELLGDGETHYLLGLHPREAPPSPEDIFASHQELYELATRQGRISVWQVDYRTNRLEFSPVLARMLGLSDEQIPTTVEQWIPRFHPDDWQQLERQTEAVIKGELPEINIECRMYHVDGRVFWTLSRGRVECDETGKPLRTFGTTIDITDRKQAEQERDLFFKLSLDLLCIADVKGYFRRVNPAFTRTLGYSEAELTSRPFFDFVHPDDLEATRQALARVIKGGDLPVFENRYRCKDGSWRWLSWTCPAVLPESQSVYAIARDVTDARRFHEDLQRAMKDAEHANRAKSEFLSRMSHELRTPLNAILGFGQLLQRQTLTSTQRQQTELIVKGGRHLLNLINEVLDITRIEVGRLDLSPESVELTELLREVVDLSQPMAKERHVRISIDQPSLRQRFVLADKQRLKQVLLNLLSNAIKYNTEHGQVRIRGEEAAGERVRILVQDTGPGIPAEKQSRLFTPFDRLGAEMSGIEGSGLGLVLSKRLVEIMGGTLTLAPSPPDQGALFIVELVQGQTATHLETIARGPAPGIVPMARRTLLYIEDNLTNIQLIEALMVYRPGIQLVPAMQGQLGLDLARRHHPDLILLDVHLPDMQGTDVLAQLRTDPELRSIPVVVISADATSTQIDRLLQGGAMEYLTKPIDIEHFLRVIDHYLLRA